MPRRARFGSTLPIAVVALVFASARPASAQYVTAYKSGLDAIEAENWTRAESSMREALSERAEEKAKLPGKLSRRPYLPHLYLGYARFEQGDCAGALEAWSESERQGVATKLAEFDVARRGRKICEERSRRQGIVVQARQDMQQALARSTATAAELLERSREPQSGVYWTKGDPSPASLHDQGLALLARARELLTNPDADPLSIKRAEAFIREADATFTELDAGLDRFTEATRLEVAAKDKGVDALVAEAKAALARTTYLAPYPRAVGKARADLQGLVAEAGRRDEASKAHLDGLAARLENSIAALDKVTEAPPAPLAKAVEAFLGGRHSDVVAELATATLPERRARAHARLLLAASRHALYLEGGELDDELRAAAVEDARACHQDDEALEPTPRFFSPRFVTFFNESVAAAAAPSS